MTNKPKVKRYDDMGCPEQICRVDTMHESDDGDYVLYEDYEALQAAHEEELFRVRQDRDTHFGEMMRALEQVDALKAECEELRKDAERYRWLRLGAHEDSDLDRWEHVGYVCGVSVCTDYGFHQTLDAEALDAAIDKAMQGDQP